MEKNMYGMKKAGAVLLALILAVSFSAPVLAASGVIKKVKYEGNGKVDVEFSGRMQYKSARVTVKDSSGKTYSTIILEKDHDDLEFKVINIETGKTYTFTISGIRKQGAEAYTEYSGEFTVPSLSTTITTPTSNIIKKVKYEKNGKVEVDFNCKVQYSNAMVTVKDTSGKVYTTKITEEDDDELEFRVSGIKSGMTYTFTISGIRKRGNTDYTSCSGSFTVPGFKNNHHDHDD